MPPVSAEATHTQSNAAAIEQRTILADRRPSGQSGSDSSNFKTRQLALNLDTIQIEKAFACCSRRLAEICSNTVRLYTLQRRTARVC